MGANAAQSSKFDKTVKMWVFEETVNGRKLTEIINTEHENVKYLPGHKLPTNVVRKPFPVVPCVTLGCFAVLVWVTCFVMSFPPQLAVPDLVEASKDADILVFVIPHQFIGKVCDTMSGNIKKEAIGISLIKVGKCLFVLYPAQETRSNWT